VEQKLGKDDDVDPVLRNSLKSIGQVINNNFQRYFKKYAQKATEMIKKKKSDVGDIKNKARQRMYVPMTKLVKIQTEMKNALPAVNKQDEVDTSEVKKGEVETVNDDKSEADTVTEKLDEAEKTEGKKNWSWMKIFQVAAKGYGEFLGEKTRENSEPESEKDGVEDNRRKRRNIGGEEEGHDEQTIVDKDIVEVEEEADEKEKEWEKFKQKYADPSKFLQDMRQKLEQGKEFEPALRKNLENIGQTIRENAPKLLEKVAQKATDMIDEENGDVEESLEDIKKKLLHQMEEPMKKLSKIQTEMKNALLEDDEEEKDEVERTEGEKKWSWMKIFNVAAKGLNDFLSEKNIEDSEPESEIHKDEDNLRKKGNTGE